MLDADKPVLAEYLSRWEGFHKKYEHYEAFKQHKIEECSCSIPKRMLENLLYSLDQKLCLPVDGGYWPGWKSPQPYVVSASTERHFTDVFRDLPIKRSRFN